MKTNIAENNFDLIRLLAATQVAFLHVMHTLSGQWSSATFAQVLEVFPGVPIFFFISGFLISRSYERTGTLGDYALNRGLRIFPALHVCVIINLLLVCATGYFSIVDVSFADVFILYLAKTTIVQFYNPDFMRHFGDGVLNGSLWTICVELQFYFLMPVIYSLFNVIGGTGNRNNCFLVLLIVISLLFNRWLYGVNEYYGTTYWKLARVSFLPWVYMFLCGVVVQKNFEFFSKFLFRNAVFILVPLYALFGYALRSIGFLMDNSFSPILFFPLILVVFICAFSFSDVARRLLKGNDISYGVYIYHVPIMNMFIYYGFAGKFVYTLVTLVICCVMAVFSWFLIEKPSLLKKRRATHPLS